MRIPAHDLTVGDVLHVNDWHLHVINIERDQAVAVLTAEFAFLIHFAPEDLVQVQARAQAA
jgi:glycogen synthase